MIERPSDPATIARLRGLCLALPAVTEKLSHGEPTWFARGRSFAMTADHHHDDRLAVWLAAPAGRQESLIETDPARYFRPPYVGHRGWIGVYLDVSNVDWDELAILADESYALIAAARKH
ncbi:MAG: MmcQ/YjbR family DNA-binding protein [Chloroflexi bacterium]|nr:MmcQ/YjbR family DNA-binding protein [Chloroflexota bacterium]